MNNFWTNQFNSKKDENADGFGMSTDLADTHVMVSPYSRDKRIANSSSILDQASDNFQVKTAITIN